MSERVKLVGSTRINNTIKLYSLVKCICRLYLQDLNLYLSNYVSDGPLKVFTCRWFPKVKQSNDD